MTTKNSNNVLNDESTTPGKQMKHPYNSAWFGSRLTIWWLGALFSLGYKRKLEIDDIYPALDRDRAQLCVEQYDSKHKQLVQSNKMKKLSLWSVFIRMYPGYIVSTGCLAIIWEAIKIFQPVLIGWLMMYFEYTTRPSIDDNTGTNETMSSTTTPSFTTFERGPIRSKEVAYACGVTLALSSFFNSFPSQFYFALQQNVATRMRAICCALIYRKSLRLSNKSMATISTGKIVNMMSTDVEKFHNGLLFLHFYWAAPVEGVVIMYLIHREIGWSLVSGLAFMLLLLPMQLAFGKIFGKLRLAAASWSDDRILAMSEVITGMRVIKMYCWEIPFAKLVHRLRISEIGVVIKAQTLKGFNSAIAILSPKLVTFLIILTYYYTNDDRDLPADRIVRLISWVEHLRMGVFTFMSYAAQFGTEMFSSMSRIEEFLNAEELVKQPPSQYQGGTFNVEDAVNLENVESQWNSIDPYHEIPAAGDTPQRGTGFKMHDISMRIKEGNLVAIVGPVGSGKTSLLMCLLGEMPIFSGTRRIQGEVAYVPQESWVFAGTIRENVLFGREYNNFAYNSALNACALDRDLELMPAGDQTLVGEKGFSLSGGQKARINMARAVYRDSDVYLLDDPLSAVDSKVGRHIFQRCICGQLRTKTRLLITHQLHFVKCVDYVYVMNDGRVVVEGTYSDVANYVEQVQSLSTASGKEGAAIISPTTTILDNCPPDRQMALPPNLIRNVSIRSSIQSKRSLQSSVGITGTGVGVADTLEAEEALPPAEEDIIEGSVSFSVFARYYAEGKGRVLFPLFLLTAVLTQVSYNWGDAFLTNWNDQTLFSESNRTYFYSGLVATMLLFSCIRSVIYVYMSCLASQNLHKSMFAAVLRSPMTFFDKNPTGRILNRFSRDTGFMDDILVQTFHQVWIFLLIFAGVVVYVTYVIWYTVVVTVPVICLIVWLRYYTMQTMRDIKRIEATVRSPMYSHLSASLMGLPVIRAFHMQTPFTKTFFKYQDEHTSAWYLFLSTSRWFGLRLDWLIAAYFTGCIVASFVITELRLGVLDSGEIGLMLSYISGMMGICQFIMRQTSEVESYMTSVERIQQYCELEPEADEHNASPPSADWPQRGQIDFNHVSLSYDQGDTHVLKDIVLTIQPKEKVGIVGRTGAGKSTLISCLFRLMEPSGELWVDGHDITKLGLTDVRRKISIIPQDPVLFTGTLRYNLDPLKEYSDEHIWQSLQAVHLSMKVMSMSGRLETVIAEAGANFSVGQRQLICLARAILKQNTILVIDEATANVDQSTDALIQKTIRSKFKDCTVLTIAHRLNTIIDYDKVLVLDNGSVKQFDHPHLLLEAEDGIFYEMVKQTGTSFQLLIDLAKQAYEHSMLTETSYDEENSSNWNDAGRQRDMESIADSEIYLVEADVHAGTDLIPLEGYSNTGFISHDEGHVTYL